MFLRWGILLFLGFSVCLPVLSWADGSGPYTIVIKDHQFIPHQLSIPIDQKIKITIDNQDPTVEEFESFDLNREKIVSGNKKIVVFIGPLPKGTYKYFGDFHQKTAQGIIVAQ
jgi:hypothetical protein